MRNRKVKLNLTLASPVVLAFASFIKQVQTHETFLILSGKSPQKWQRCFEEIIQKAAMAQPPSKCTLNTVEAWQTRYRWAARKNLPFSKKKTVSKQLLEKYTCRVPLKTTRTCTNSQENPKKLASRRSSNSSNSPKPLELSMYSSGYLRWSCDPCTATSGSPS